MAGTRGELVAWSANSGEVRQGGGGEKIDDFILTKAKLARRWGGGGREDYGEALGELGDVFLPGRRS